MFYDIVSFPVWLIVAALVGAVVGWMTYTDAPRRGWFAGWAAWGAIVFVIGLIVAVLKLLPGRAGLWLEIALLMMFIYIVCCFLGGWLKGLMAEPEQPRATQDAVMQAEAARAAAAAKAESDRLAAETAATVEADRQADVAKAESDRQAAAVKAESVRLAGEVASKADADRKSAAAKNESDRLAAEAAAKAEADRQAAAAKADSDRLAAEAAAKAEADRQAAAAKAESDRLAAETAAKAEADRQAAAAKAESDRLAAEAAAKAEADRQAAAAKAESDRLAAEAAAKAEADRKAAAAKAESDRLATETAAKAEADRQAAAAKAESDRLAADAAAKTEAVHQPPVAAGPGPGVVPVALAAPNGAADDLKLIKGIGPNNERTLNGLGVYHFSQIADWTPDNAIWMGHHMAFPGRIEREHWIPQAKLLAAGIDTEHSAGVKSGTITIDDSADAPLDEAEASSFAASMPATLPPVEGEARHAGARPLGLAAPRGGVADDLKRIKGIGKQNEARLHGLGVWHFDQIAAWSAENVKWVGSYLAFSGRIDREKWISQSTDLAAGRQTEFAKRVDAGLVKTSLDDGSLGQDNVEKVAPKGK